MTPILSLHQRLIYLLWRNGIIITEIARRLGVTPTTINNQVVIAKAKLGAERTAPRPLCPWPPGSVWA